MLTNSALKPDCSTVEVVTETGMGAAIGLTHNGYIIRWGVPERSD